MIDLYSANTPNGEKITIFLEEAEIPYKIIPINFENEDQFKPDFLKISPNNKIPAIVDNAPHDASGPLSVFESGAILWYLATKENKFISQDICEKTKISEWLFWQMAGLGPISGQNWHFSHHSEKIPYAIERFQNETRRLYNVLNKQLKTCSYIAGDYSIADMAIFPWIRHYEALGQNLEDFPAIKTWFKKIGERPAVIKAFNIQESL